MGLLKSHRFLTQKNMKYTLLLTLALLLSLVAIGQNNMNYVQGEVLIRLENDGNLKNVINAFQTFEGQDTDLKIGRKVSKHLKIWLLEFNQNVAHERFLDALYMDANIMETQSNHTVELRSTTPNDVGFAQQWQYINTGQSGGTAGADLDAELAWDVTTGGLTPLGDTIVVAVIDEGFDITHPDFGDNLWRNYNEIPNNGIDDDNNGFIDDYLGWNVSQNNDDVTNGGSHGTPVAGIVGAKGNNGTGVAGVNWNVKVMVIRLVSTVEADVLEAYDYTLQNRMLYNQTNGAAGAFVVATNASWGINNGQPSQAPLWCAFYDTLGVHGILNAGATANANFNIDVTGDLPTACSSDYMVAVTNINHNDQKVTQAGYGATTIDLGAFGQGTWTLSGGGGYGGFGGTSGATPHVAGMIGLLYSVPCVSFAILAKTNPDSAALLMKQFIMNGTDANASLNGITVSGGRLNMNGAIQEMLNYCPASVACVPPYGLNASNISDTSAILTWGAITDTITNFNIQYRVAGTAWTTVTMSDSILSYNLTGLMPCTTYEFQVEMDCDTSTSGYSNIFTFQTDGCCTPPDGLVLTSVTDTTANLSWNSVLAAQSYDIRYRESGSPITAWTDVLGLTTLNYQFTGLTFCATYEVEIRTICQNDTTAYGTIFYFNSGCGACTSLAYCTTQGNSIDDEWIEEVQFGTINNNSGVAISGYTDFTSISTTVLTGQVYPISLTQGYAGTVYPEVFTVWIDFNQNGTFEATESIYTSGTTTTFPNTGNIIIPTTALLGATRMRVSMKYNGVSTACEAFAYGEAEDYCITIQQGGTPQCDVPTNIGSSNTTTSGTTLSWDAMPFAVSYDIRYREVGTMTWMDFSAMNTTFVASNLTDCTDYEYEISTNCGMNNSSAYSSTANFTTVCICNEIADLDTVSVNELDASFTWSATTNNVDYVLEYKATTATNWIAEPAITNITYQLTNLQPATTYEARVRINCTGNVISNPSNVVTFYTDWTVGTNNLPTDVERLNVYPNPFNQSIQLVIDAVNGQNIGIEIFDLSGKLIISEQNQTIHQGTNALTINTTKLLSGMYILKVRTEKGLVTKRIVKE
jgi:subtilisin family serine protease